MSTNDSFETVSVAVGIGTILGLSTISFYEHPTQHLSNALLGAGIGLVVGLGVVAYMLYAQPENEIEPDELIMPSDSGEKKNRQDKRNKNRRGGFYRSPQNSIPARALSRNNSEVTLAHRFLPPQEGWSIGMRVLELRF